MSGRAVWLKHSLPILIEKQQVKLDKTNDMNLVGLGAKRMAEDNSTEYAWQRLSSISEAYRAIGIRRFWRELNGAGDYFDPQNPKVFLDFTNKEPREYEDPFIFPVLADDRLRNANLGAFTTLVARFPADSYLVIGTSENGYRPTYPIRGIVPVIAKDKWECDPNILHTLAYHHPASCQSFEGGDPITKIDEFFSVNRTQQNVGGIAFVDTKTIDKWIKESNFLKKGDNPTVLAIRLKELPEYQIVIISIASVFGVLAMASMALCGNEAKVKDLLNTIKEKISGTGRCLQSQAGDSAPASIAGNSNIGNTNPAVIDMDSTDDNAPIFFDGEEVELQAMANAKKSDGNVNVDGAVENDEGESSSEVV